MKLIEKKCPNCGANLEFNENDKSCKCEYCHRAFEIERENNVDVKDIAEQFNLSELETPIKYFSTFMIGGYLITAVVGIIAFIAIGFIGFNIFKNVSGGSFGSNLYTDVSEFDNEDFGDFNDKAYSIISANDDNLDSYDLEMNVKREKTYLAYNKDKNNNIVYVVYKATYKKFLENNKYVVYVPIRYDNLKDEFGALIFQLDDGKVEAPEYYLNMDHSEYTYGYKDVETFEKDVIDNLSGDYKVSKK